MKQLKKMLCTLLIIFGVLSLLAVLIVFVFFRAMPDETKIRKIEADSYGLKYFVTETDELYIGGDHGDRYGLYDTGFYWGFLYGSRRLFCRSDAPVRFAENVADVYPGTNGFLYTDIGGTLYYFGESTGGKITKIATDVQTASVRDNCIVYATFAGDAYCKTCVDGAWGEAKQLANNVSQIYTNGFLARIVDKDGNFYQVRIDDAQVPTVLPGDGLYFEKDIQYMTNSYDRTALLTKSGELICYFWESGQENQVLWTAGTVRLRKSMAAQALAADVNIFSANCYVSADGQIYQFTEDSVMVVGELNRNDVVDVAACLNGFYVVFADGSYISVN